MLFVVIIDQTRIFENVSAFKLVLQCTSRTVIVIFRPHLCMN